MDSITATNIVRDNLRTNLADAYTLILPANIGRPGNQWIFADEPATRDKYPQIQIKKIDNPSEILTIGTSYGEREYLYLNVWFYNKNGFKIVVSGAEYKNSQVVEYYQGLIKTSLKAQHAALHTSGAKGYKHLNTTTVAYDPDTQLYFGAVSIRVEYYVVC